MEKGYEGEFYNSHKCFNDVVKFKSRFKATKLASIKRDLSKLNINMKNNFFYHRNFVFQHFIHQTFFISLLTFHLYLSPYIKCPKPIRISSCACLRHDLWTHCQPFSKYKEE